MDLHHNGLGRDLATMLDQGAGRRALLRWLGAGAASVAMGGCGRAAGSAASCPAIPDETAGPFPADGSNRNALGVANALAMTGIVRRDIRASAGAPAAEASTGVPLEISLQVVDVAGDCKPMAGAAVYLWHCDRLGNYSMYSPGLEGQTFLRGVQVADERGMVAFSTIFPGCYPGRIPHVHFEVYPSLERALGAMTRLKTSQFTFPAGAIAEAYKDPAYASSAGHLKGVSLERDSVFRDGGGNQIASVYGTLAQGFNASLTLGVVGA